MLGPEENKFQMREEVQTAFYVNSEVDVYSLTEAPNLYTVHRHLLPQTQLWNSQES